MQQITNFMEKGLAEGVFPGAVLTIFDREKIIYSQSFGSARLEPEAIEMQSNTLFDLASLTKVIATTTAIMLLLERGELNLYDSIKNYFPEGGEDKREITIYHLLTHTSGFQAIIELWNQVMSCQEKIAYILNLPLQYPPGEKMIYSDPNFILLGELAQRISGLPLDQFADRYIFQPLNMVETGFNPLQSLSEDINRYAATEYCPWRQRIAAGEVADKNAYFLGGVSGHAGLFSTGKDLTRFGQMLLNCGNCGSHRGKRLLTPRTIELMISNQTPAINHQRGLGWDLISNYKSSGGVMFSPRAFGHTGFTGTSIWLDLSSGLGVILLSNRIHPDRKNTRIISFRPRLHNFIIVQLQRAGLLNYIPE